MAHFSKISTVKRFAAMPKVSPRMLNLTQIGRGLKTGSLRKAYVGPANIGICIDRNGLMIQGAVFGGGDVSTSQPPLAAPTQPAPASEASKKSEAPKKLKEALKVQNFIPRSKPGKVALFALHALPFIGYALYALGAPVLGSPVALAVGLFKTVSAAGIILGLTLTLNHLPGLLTHGIFTIIKSFKKRGAWKEFAASIKTNADKAAVADWLKEKKNEKLQTKYLRQIEKRSPELKSEILELINGQEDKTPLAEAKDPAPTGESRPAPAADSKVGKIKKRLATLSHDAKGFDAALKDLRKLASIKENKTHDGDINELNEALGMAREIISKYAEKSGLKFFGKTPAHKPKEYCVLPRDKDAKKEGSLARNGTFLGKGAMAEVYQAVDLETGEIAAVKIVLDPKNADRFETEFKNMAKVKHPLAVKVHAFGSFPVNGGYRPAIVMEYIDAPTLKDALKKGIVDDKKATNITLQICDVMHSAHKAGVYHRDLKPENIFYNEKTGKIKVADFGLGLDIGEIGDQSATGMYAGTPSYSAPYYVAEYSVKSRAERKELAETLMTAVLRGNDIYAAGVILYRMLTGYPLILWSPKKGKYFIITEPDAKPHSSVENLNFITHSKRYEMYRDAKDEAERQRIKATLTLVQENDSPLSIRKIPDNLFPIISMAVAIHHDETFADFHDFKTALDRFREGKPPVTGLEPTLESKTGPAAAKETVAVRVKPGETKAGEKVIELGSADIKVLDESIQGLVIPAQDTIENENVKAARTRDRNNRKKLQKIYDVLEVKIEQLEEGESVNLTVDQLDALQAKIDQILKTTKDGLIKTLTTQIKSLIVDGMGILLLEDQGG